DRGQGACGLVAGLIVRCVGCLCGPSLDDPVRDDGAGRDEGAAEGHCDSGDVGDQSSRGIHRALTAESPASSTAARTVASSRGSSDVPTRRPVWALPRLQATPARPPPAQRTHTSQCHQVIPVIWYSCVVVMIVLLLSRYPQGVWTQKEGYTPAG